MWRTASTHSQHYLDTTVPFYHRYRRRWRLFCRSRCRPHHGQKPTACTGPLRWFCPDRLRPGLASPSPAISLAQLAWHLSLLGTTRHPNHHRLVAGQTRPAGTYSSTGGHQSWFAFIIGLDAWPLPPGNIRPWQRHRGMDRRVSRASILAYTRPGSYTRFNRSFIWHVLPAPGPHLAGT